MTRSLRRWTTFLCLAGFLFAQLTLAVYACPLRATTPQPAAMVHAGDLANAPCPGHERSSVPDAGPLCEVHCEGQNGVPAGGSSVVIPPLALAPFPVVLSFDVETIRQSFVARIPLSANAAAPPLAQQFCRLLI